MLIHIIDPDVGRRAVLSRAAFDLGTHAEIYEDSKEFEEANPHEGLIFAFSSEAPALLDVVSHGGVELPVVVYAEQPGAREVVEAVQAGALDFFEWPTNPEHLERILQRAEHAGHGLHVMLRKRAAARKLVARLSPRECEVLLGIISGGANKSIGAELGISPRTVEIHRSNMMRKLGAEAVGDAVRIALYAGLDSKIALAA